jgi:hypothetical protein
MDHPADSPEHRSLFNRVTSFARRKPVTTLALAAGATALAGAEMLAVALAGGAAAVLVIRRGHGSHDDHAATAQSHPA